MIHRFEKRPCPLPSMKLSVVSLFSPEAFALQPSARPYYASRGLTVSHSLIPFLRQDIVLVQCFRWLSSPRSVVPGICVLPLPPGLAFCESGLGAPAR